MKAHLIEQVITNASSVWLTCRRQSRAWALGSYLPVCHPLLRAGMRVPGATRLKQGSQFSWEDGQGLKPQNDLPKRVKTKPLLADPNSSCFIIFILQQALCLERIKENLYWRRPTTVPPQNGQLISSTCKHFCTYMHTWTHTDIQNPFFSWQKALSEARVGPWMRLWFSKVWLAVCSLLLMPLFFSLSHPEESHCLIPTLWQV